MLDLKALALPFPVTQISWRVGSTTADKTKGMALAYIDARDVMERLDDVCGPDGWQDTYPHAGTKTVCSIGIWCGAERGWVYKSNGAGDTDHEAEKGALSDAFKRAGVMWGIGRYLYNLPSPWVAIKQRGKSYVIDDAEEKRLLDVLQKFSAGLAIPRDPYPVNPDVLEAANKWVADSEAALSTMVNEADVRAWDKKYEKALLKLKGQSEPLYERIKKSYNLALVRTQRLAA